MITNKGRLDTLLNLSSNDDSFTPMGLGFGVITDTKMEGEVFYKYWLSLQNIQRFVATAR
jgi:hypothetical protein